MPLGIRLSPAAVGFAAATALGLSQASAATACTQSGRAAASASTTVEVCGQGAGEAHPGNMILTCADSGEIAERLAWDSWTASSATATGQVAWRSCRADCARTTTWQSTPADFTLSRPRDIPGHGRIFTELTLHATGPTPAGFMRDLTFDETPASAAPTPSPVSSRPPALVPRAATARFDSDSDSDSGSDSGSDSDASSAATLGYAQAEGYWIAAGGSADTAATAAAIAGAESDFEPGVIQQDVDYCGPGGDRAGWGLWQITCGDSVPAFGTDFRLLDPWNNAEAAVAKYEDADEESDRFDLWSTYTSGDYQSFMQDVAPDSDLIDPGQYVQDGGAPAGTPSSSAADPGSTYGPAMPGGDQAS